MHWGPMNAPDPQTYKLKLNMSVLDALGIRLYSNATAVLSEVVANAWDADSNRVDITWDHNAGQVQVRDDGSGMTVDELNERYLNVGYPKRQEEGSVSAKFGRPFMGRKGIGKLSVFSIADEVKLLSRKDGKTNGFIIQVPELRKKIEQNAVYHPTPVEGEELDADGTFIELRQLRVNRTHLTAAALRKRLARRFDVLTVRKPEDGDFGIYVNGDRLTYEDRQELKLLEYIWEIGETSIPDENLPSGIKRFRIDDDVVGGKEEWKVAGWFGTARKPNDLVADDEAGSLKNIIVLARNRPIQEGILEKLNFNRLFSNYVTGQICADFLDLDGDYDDIATSDRQRLMEDDPRVLSLQKYLREKFLPASERWAEERPKKKVSEVKNELPEIKSWIDGLEPWQRGAAEAMIGTIASLDFDTQKGGSQKADLYRSGILAFERIGLRKTSEDLDALSGMDAASLLPVLERQDTYEAALYADILKSRIEAITTFKSITSTDEKEKVLQEHLFKHLWLLDSSWERASGSDHMEQDLRRIDAEAFSEDPTIISENGRIDIRYRNAAGKHIIVELKRYERKVDVDELYAQGLKYVNALNRLLQRSQAGNPVIEVVFVIGDDPTGNMKGLEDEKDYIKKRMSSINGRYVTYDHLINSALFQYDEYLSASKKANDLNAALNRIERMRP